MATPNNGGSTTNGGGTVTASGTAHTPPRENDATVATAIVTAATIATATVATATDADGTAVASIENSVDSDESIHNPCKSFSEHLLCYVLKMLQLAD